MMAKISVCYEENEDGMLLPMRMVIKFGRGRFKWDAQRFAIPLGAPVERFRTEDFFDDSASVSVTLSELMRNADHQDRFFLSIPLLVARLEQMKKNGDIPMDFDYEDIQQFIVWMGDIEEIMQMEISRIYEWR